MTFIFKNKNGRFVGLGYGGTPKDATALASEMHQEKGQPGYDLVSHEIVDNEVRCVIVPKERLPREQDSAPEV